VNPLLASLASQFAGKEQPGAVLGFAQSFGGVARTIGPLWAGFLFARLAPAAPFVSGAVAALICAALGLVLRSERTAARA
jgi:MFS family permease